MVIPLALGDVLTLKKAHPCGSCQWRVERLGADIGIRCTGCQRYVLLDRVVLERRIRSISSRVSGQEAPGDTRS